MTSCQKDDGHSELWIMVEQNGQIRYFNFLSWIIDIHCRFTFEQFLDCNGHYTHSGMFIYHLSSMRVIEQQ